MAAKKPAVAVPTKQDQQIDHLTMMANGYKNQLAETTAELERERTARRENSDIAGRWKKKAEGLETEVGNLREELHGITVDKARLEGYIDRARQFDPQPETKLVTVPEEMVRHFRTDGYGNGVADFYASQKNGPQPWYKRDV